MLEDVCFEELEACGFQEVATLPKSKRKSWDKSSKMYIIRLFQ